MSGPGAKFNNFFFSNSCRWVALAKFGFLIENIAWYLKQYLFCVSKQHIPLFLSIMLNWPVEGNLTLREFTKCCHDRHCQNKFMISWNLFSVGGNWCQVCPGKDQACLTTCSQVGRTPDLYLRHNNFKSQSENLTLTSIVPQIRPRPFSFKFLPTFRF